MRGTPCQIAESCKMQNRRLEEKETRRKRSSEIWSVGPLPESALCYGKPPWPQERRRRIQEVSYRPIRWERIELFLSTYIDSSMKSFMFPRLPHSSYDWRMSAYRLEMDHLDTSNGLLSDKARSWHAASVYSRLAIVFTGSPRRCSRVNRWVWRASGGRANWISSRTMGIFHTSCEFVSNFFIMTRCLTCEPSPDIQAPVRVPDLRSSSHIIFT